MGQTICVMESNKEEALRCFDIAKGCFSSGNLEKALRLFTKSNSMYPTEAAKHWIEKTMREAAATEKTNNPRPTTNNPTPKDQVTPDKPATKKQKDEVERIMRDQRSYYKVLNIDRSASSKQIEKSYRKLILIIHPDKNPHPQASEAFNVLQSAKDCLTNEQTREIYNATGQDPAKSKVGRSPFAGNRNFYDLNGMRNRHSSYTFRGSPDDFFHHFANNPEFIFRQQRATRMPRRTANIRPENDSNLGMAALQLLLLFSFAFMFFFTSGSSDDTPNFSLTQTRTYSVQRFTKNGIPFYVPRGFDDKKLDSMTNEITESWLQKMTKLCSDEKRDRYLFMTQVENFSPQRKREALEKLNNEKLYHCELLEHYHKLGSV